MSTNLPINHLVLLEIIIILAIGLVVVLVTAFRQHFMLKKLFAKFIELRESRDGSNTQNSAPLEVYFARSINDSRRQYETLTSSKTIIFDTTSPYSQKVIALRYLYLTVEKEAEEQRLIRPVGWDFYETKLDLLLKLINKGKESNDVGVLQAQLDQSRTESTTTINLLKDMIDKLQNSLAPSTSITVEKGMQDILDAISSNESILNIKDLFEQIKFLSSQLKISPNLVERSISTLEYEVEVSDKYLTKIRSNPNPVTVDLKEIKKLRESNKIQRNTIASLEDEINALRNSVTKNTSAEIRAETEAEISRLALAVKEYEGCVKILEEQIDSLYAQVESKSEQQEHTPTNQQKEM